MFVLIVIVVGLLGYLLAAAWRLRHRVDPMRHREQAFATMRHWAESPRAQFGELAERTPVFSGQVRILSGRPAGRPRSRRQPPTRCAGSGTKRRRTSTTSQPKIAVIPTSPSVTSSRGVAGEKTPRGRDIEVLAHPSTVLDLDRVGADVETNASTEGMRSHNTVRVTLLRNETESLMNEISAKLRSGPIGVRSSGSRSRSKRPTGGSHDALDAAIKQAIDYANN